MPGGDGYHGETRKGRKDGAAVYWCCSSEEKCEKEKQRVNHRAREQRDLSLSRRQLSCPREPRQTEAGRESSELGEGGKQLRFERRIK